MADILKIENSTIITGTVTLTSFLVGELNDKQIGFPVFKYDPSTTTPNIDLIELIKTDFVLKNATLYNDATSYEVGLATYINNTAFALPMFRLDQEPDNFIDFKVVEPTIVTNLTATGEHVVARLGDEYYGIPLYDFTGTFLGEATTPASAVSINTTLVTNLILDVTPESGSTHLNSKIRSYSKLIDRVKKNLGWPNINVNICDENIVDYIDQALEYYTKYAGYTEEYLMFSTKLYERGCGVRLDRLFSMTPEMRQTCYERGSASFDYDLDTYRKVIDVFGFEQGEGVGINTLFTLEQAMAQQTYYGYMLGNTGFDLVTWEVLKGWLDTRKKVLAQTPRIIFDNKTQMMRIIPEPWEQQSYVGVVGCFVERPIRDLISEPWVIEYTIALTSIALGRIYGKFTNMSLPIGGGSINYGDLQQYGLKRKEELERELYTGYGFAETAPPTFFVG